jgi:hypothetical protein
VSGNAASALGGGIILHGYLTITNSTLVNNAATGAPVGAAIFVSASGSYYSQTLRMTNSILWGSGPEPLALVPTTGFPCAAIPSSTVEFSLVQGGWPGAGNIDGDPFFADPWSGNFHLLEGSPCIDAGSNVAVPATVLFDLDGRNRFIEDSLTPDTGRPGRMRPIVDMGAYEGPFFPGRHVRRR